MPRTAGPVHRVLDGARAQGLRKLLGAEVRSPVRLARPLLLARGFNSDRRWLYDTTPRSADGYVSDLAYATRVPRVDTPKTNASFRDKLRFARTLQASGFGHHLPLLVGVVRDGGFTQEADHSGGPVVRKPVDSRAGLGVTLSDSLEEALRTCPGRGTFLLQEQVRAHSYARDIFPRALNTLRVQTFRAAAGSPAEVAVVVHRFGREATAPVDTFGAGGLVARVRPNGTLSVAVGPVIRRQRDEHEHHPDTGGRIAGRTVPHHREALGLTLSVMELWPAARWIGWDVAISEAGPVIVEGNGDWPNLAMLQAHGPLGAEPGLRRFLQQNGFLPQR